MAQTFSDWNNVPTVTERKIRKVWNGSGTACHEHGYDCNSDRIEVYKLASYRVSDNLDYLTDEQKIKLFEIAAERSIILSNLLQTLSFEIEMVRVRNEVYHLPGTVVGTWPHCGLFGGMSEDGYIHT